MNIQKDFERLGYPVLFNQSNSRIPKAGYRIDTGFNGEGQESFLISLKDSIELISVNVNKKEEAMLVLLRDKEAPYGKRNLAKLLLGHDERQLFVAAVPTNTKSVIEAKDKLKPQVVHRAEQRAQVKRSKKNKHKNKARIRQGDFFFIPITNTNMIDEKLIQKNQPLRRGNRGNAHTLEESVETGGRQGYEWNGNFITVAKFNSLDKNKKMFYRPTRRNPVIYARGKVRHPEHKTIKLNGWHLVVPNTENTVMDTRGRPVLGRLTYTD